MSDEVIGTLEVTDGKLQLPEKYVRASQFVVRQRSITQDWRSGRGIDFVIWHDDRNHETEPQNPGLAPDEALLKVYGEPAERYRVEGNDE